MLYTRKIDAIKTSPSVNDSKIVIPHVSNNCKNVEFKQNTLSLSEMSRIFFSGVLGAEYGIYQWLLKDNPGNLSYFKIINV